MSKKWSEGRCFHQQSRGVRRCVACAALGSPVAPQSLLGSHPRDAQPSAVSTGLPRLTATPCTLGPAEPGPGNVFFRSSPGDGVGPSPVALASLRFTRPETMMLEVGRGGTAVRTVVAFDHGRPSRRLVGVLYCPVGPPRRVEDTHVAVAAPPCGPGGSRRTSAVQFKPSVEPARRMWVAFHSGCAS